MASKTELPESHLFDFDDILFDRGQVTRLIGLLAGSLKPYRSQKFVVADLQHVNREILDNPPASVFEWLSLLAHSHRRVIHGVVPFLRQLSENGAVICGNTGRRATRMWMEMTQQALERGKIASYFKDVFYTPVNTPTAVSKAAALQKFIENDYRVFHYDDDPRTICYLAALFPRASFGLVYYPITSRLIPAPEIMEYPNITLLNPDFSRRQQA